MSLSLNELRDIKMILQIISSPQYQILSDIVNTITADDLAIQGANASANMILIKLAKTKQSSFHMQRGKHI